MASRHIRPVREHEIINVEQTWRPFQVALRTNFHPCLNLDKFQWQNLSLRVCKAVLLLKNNSLGTDLDNIHVSLSFPCGIFLNRLANFVIFWLSRNIKSLSLNLKRFV